MQAGLDLQHDAGVEVVAHVGGDDADGAGAPLAQALGGKAGHVPLLPRDGEHALARPLAHATLVVEHVGHGRGAHAGEARYVIDGCDTLGHGPSPDGCYEQHTASRALASDG